MRIGEPELVWPFCLEFRQAEEAPADDGSSTVGSTNVALGPPDILIHVGPSGES